MIVSLAQSYSISLLGEIFQGLLFRLGIYCKFPESTEYFAFFTYFYQSVQY